MKIRSAILGLVIIALWVGTMVVLVQRHSAPDALPDDDSHLFGGVRPAAKWQDIDEWMLIVRHDPQSGNLTPLGAAHTSIIQNDSNTTGAVYRAEFNLEVKPSPIIPRIFVKGAANLDKDANLTNFYASGQATGISLSANGAVRRKLLYLKLDKPNNISYSIKRLPQPVKLAEVLRPSLGRHMTLEPGEKMSSPVIDPLTGQNRGRLTVSIEKKETIQLDNKPVEAFRVKTTVGDIETLMWVDEEGRTLRRNLVGGVRMDRTTRERALEIAPSLADDVEIPELDLTEFEGVQVESVEPASSNDSGIFGSGLLGSIMG